jgi:hypothetical protein
MTTAFDEAMAALAAGGSPAGINAALRRARDALGADGLITALRQALPGSSLPVPALGILGAFIRAARPAIGPAELLHERPPMMPPYVNVLGTSHVRVFGCRPYFFPVFAGMGPDMMLLTDASAEASVRRIADNFARLDKRQDTLMVLSGEALCHVLNYHKTRPEAGPVTELDRDFMRASLGRYNLLLPGLQRLAEARVALLNALPTYDPVLNELARQLNDGLRELCPLHGVHFIDVWDQLTDPATGLLRREMAAEAYNDDVHLSEAAMPLLESALREIGFLTPRMEQSPEAPWSYVFTLPVSPGSETRLWSETNVIPANAFKSEKVAAAHVGIKALEHLLPQLLAVPKPNLLILNAREGFLGTMLPPGLAERCTSLIETEGRLTLARRIAAFCGRFDLDLQLIAGAKVQKQYDFVLAMLHPDDLKHDLQRLAGILQHLQCQRVMVVAPNAAAAEPLAQAGFTPRASVLLGNRLLPERWRETVLLL